MSIQEPKIAFVELDLIRTQSTSDECVQDGSSSPSVLICDGGDSPGSNCSKYNIVPMMN